jgi:ADP-ribose pyrophosphatase YjhB (NUDIX family)
VSPSTPTFSRRIPEGEERLRHVCDHCGFVDYRNPRVVVGAVCLYRDRVLLCRRAIEPRVGYWTIPSGFLELGESCAEGAAREAREEAGVEIEIDALLALYDVPRIGHVHLIYRARLPGPEVVAGPESEEARLFAWSEIPWRKLAFPTVLWSLRRFDAVRDQKSFPAVANPDSDSAGWRELEG